MLFSTHTNSVYRWGGGREGGGQVKKVYFCEWYSYLFKLCESFE